MDILGPAEQAVVDAMLRSSPPPPSPSASSLLGKRTYPRFGDAGDGDNTEPDTADTAATDCSTLVIGDTPTDILFRWVSRKKLRGEQREEVQDFFEVSGVITLGELQAELWLGHCTNKRDKTIRHFIVTREQA